MSNLIEKLFNHLLLIICIYGITSAITPLFGYQIFTFPIKFEAIQNLSFDYVRLLLLRSCVFLTISIFLFNYAIYRRPYSALAPLVVFSYLMSIFEFLSQFTIQQITDYSSNLFAVVFWLIIAVMAHYRNSKSANTIFKD